MNTQSRHDTPTQELDQLDREYEHARSRAAFHADGTARGDFASAMFYQGAVSRMEELLARMLTIREKMSLSSPEKDQEAAV